MWSSVVYAAQGRRVRSALLDWIFPRTCIECGALVRERDERFTCSACRRKYAFIKEPVCACCGVPFFGVLAVAGTCEACRTTPPRFIHSRSLFLYRGTGGRLVHALKYEHGTYLLPEIAALLEGDATWETYFGNASLIPVPLHPRKLRRRGYNQAEIVARAAQTVFPKTLVLNALRRTRMTQSQTFLRRRERLRNMRGAFACDQSPPTGRPVMLIDDVLTTGATLNAAARALQAAGVSTVSAFTLAHG